MRASRAAVCASASLLLALCSAACKAQAPNSVLLIAKPGLSDPNFSRSVVLVTQAEGGSTVGVILNRPTSVRHEPTGEPVFTGGPVMPRTMVALFRSETVPAAPSFHVLQGIYLSMHPAILGNLKPPYRLYSGFAGWAPGQLEAEIAHDGWHVLPASAELLFRADSAGMWEELVERASAHRTSRR
jgi:putative transcriptional regulator